MSLLEESRRGRPEFTTTRWSVVLRAGGTSPEEARAALEQLCRDYWYPLYAYCRRRGLPPEDAADLTQAFFAKLLANDFAQGLSPDGGRFRSFLLAALNRYLVSEWRKEQRQKRGSGAPRQSLDALIEERGEASYLAEAAHAETPDRLFHRAWAQTLLARVLERLEAECPAEAVERFRVLRPFLAAGEDPPALADAAARLGLTLPAVKSVLHRLRQRYRYLLLDEVGQTLGSRGDAVEELRGLLEALREG